MSEMEARYEAKLEQSYSNQAAKKDKELQKAKRDLKKMTVELALAVAPFGSEISTVIYIVLYYILQ